MHILINIVKNFLKTRINNNEKCLLALSGGVDSMSLLYILIECQVFINFKLHIVHLDHNWRKESKKEAQYLKQLIEKMNLPFHSYCLNKTIISNVENQYRNERYNYFSKLQKIWNFKGILLAHQADDQAETILKRICEGSRLHSIFGLKDEKMLYNMIIWRPLLNIPKKTLIQFLIKKKINPIEDKTNKNIYYLRNRMRLKIFPTLEKFFKKKITKNFNKIGLFFKDLNYYFEDKIKIIKLNLVKSPFGSYLKNPLKYNRLELKFFLEQITKDPKNHLSSDSCNLLLDKIENKSINIKIKARALLFILNKNYLFLINKKFPNINSKKWKKIKTNSNWHDCWQGIISETPLNCEKKNLNQINYKLRNQVKKWYAKYDVPLFFYNKTPIFFLKKKIIGECLTGKSII